MIFVPPLRIFVRDEQGSAFGGPDYLDGPANKRKWEDGIYGEGFGKTAIYA